MHLKVVQNEEEVPACLARQPLEKVDQGFCIQCSADGIMTASMGALAADSVMSKQALDSEKARSRLKGMLLGPIQLYEVLRTRATRMEHNCVPTRLP